MSKPVRWALFALPMILTYVVSWIPQINGPHLWFGLPSLFVWFCLVSSVVVMVVLWLFERTRPDYGQPDPDVEAAGSEQGGAR